MKKYGEVIDKKNNSLTIRVYEKKYDEYEPSTLTVNAHNSLDCEVGDLVQFDMNMLLFYFSTVSGYILPFILAFVATSITGLFTSNILITQSVLLISLIISYIFAAKISNLPFFKRLSVSNVLKLSEKDLL